MHKSISQYNHQPTMSMLFFKHCSTVHNECSQRVIVRIRPRSYDWSGHASHHHVGSPGCSGRDGRSFPRRLCFPKSLNCQGTPWATPYGSMYGIYANIWGILMVNVTIYTVIIYSIHGSYGYSNGDPNGRNGDPVAGQDKGQHHRWCLRVHASRQCSKPRLQS